MRNLNRIMLCMVLILSGNLAFGAAEIFISPEGDDSNTGGRDHPLRTVFEAQKRIRDQKIYPRDNSPVVYLKGGKYYINSGLHFGPPDSGGPNSTITYQGMSGEKVELLGAEIVRSDMIREVSPDEYSNFSKLKKSDLHIYYVEPKMLSFDLGKKDKRGQFYPFIPSVRFNGKMLRNAYWPDSGWSIISDNSELENPVYFDSVDVSLGEKGDYQNIYIHGYFEHNWADEYLGVRDVDMDRNRLYVNNLNSYFVKFKRGQRWNAINVKNSMDDDGEYYIDFQKKRVYFVAGQISPVDVVEVNFLSSPIISITNASNILFRNIRFGNTLGDAVLIENSRGIVLDKCDFSDINGSGVQISGGSDNKLIGSELARIGGTAINVQGGDRKSLQPANHIVSGNTIHDFGLIRNTYAPAVSVGGVGISVIDNTIFNGPHAAVLLSGNNHVVAKNDISNVVRETSDAGMIYIGRDWTMRGHLISDNFLHDSISSMGGDVNAIYLDDLSSGITVSKNVIDNVARGVLIGGGRDNIVEQNAFFRTEMPVWFDSRGVGNKRELIVNSPKGSSWNLFDKLKAVEYSSSVYKTAYPKLASIMAEEPLEPRGNSIYGNYYDSSRKFSNWDTSTPVEWYYIKDNKLVSDQGVTLQLESKKNSWYALSKYYSRAR